MSSIFKVCIADNIVEEKLKQYYGKDYKLDLDIRYQVESAKTKIDIIFTKDNKALWIFKYKKEYYMNVIDGIFLKDKYTVLDVYTTLIENAIASLKAIKTA
jgi:hypothetical protein